MQKLLSILLLFLASLLAWGAAAQTSVSANEYALVKSILKRDSFYAVPKTVTDSVTVHNELLNAKRLARLFDFNAIATEKTIFLQPQVSTTDLLITTFNQTKTVSRPTVKTNVLVIDVSIERRAIGAALLTFTIL
jgi:hypothetical protein